MNQRVENLFEKGTDRRGLPPSSMGSHLEPPQMNTDAAEACVGDAVFGWPGFQGEQCCATTDMKVGEPVIAECFVHCSSVVFFGREP